MMEIAESLYTNIDEKIDDFLKGKMSPEEEMAFKTELKNNPDLRIRAREAIALIKGVKKFGKETDRATIAAIRNYEKKNGYKSAKIISMARVVIPMSIAAMFICGFFTNKMLLNQSSMNFAQQESFSFIESMSDGLRGVEDDELVNELSTLFNNALNGKDLNNTINTLKEKFDESRDDYVDDIDDYSSRIGWFLAVAYLNNNQKDEAKAVLQQVVNDNPDALSAKELLQKLNKTFFFQ